MPITTINTLQDKKTYQTLTCAVVLALCLIWLYRLQLLNGFSLLAGDRYDGVISATILEHWFKFFRGDANWAEVGYFFPHTRVIAQSDGLFLIGLIYVPFRALGFDPFIAAELANICIKAIGFCGMYSMSRRIFKLPYQWALLAAVLFTLSNSMTVHSSRSQLATVAFAPYLVILIGLALDGLQAGAIKRFRLFGCGAGVLFGALCLTCFYMAWFFALFFAIFIVVLLVKGGRSGLRRATALVGTCPGSILLILGCTLLALAPFVYAYLPKSRETGVRLYQEALIYTVPFQNILQVGDQNIYLGKFYNQILRSLQPDYAPVGEYYNTGFPVVLFLLFIIMALRVLIAKPAGTSLLITSLILATLIALILPLRLYGHSPWIVVFNYFPGAKALRVVSAFYIFLALPVTLLAVRYLSIKKMGVAATTIIVALLIVEELNTPALGLDRQAELARISKVSAPPGTCRSFYTSEWSGQDKLGGPADLYAHNVSAMMIAQQVAIPALNGIASFQAPDWNFGNPGAADYDARVASYAYKNHLTGVCKLNLNTKQWQPINQLAILPKAMKVNYFEKSAWPGELFDVQGMSPPEPWGAWSMAKTVDFEFTTTLPSRFELRLTGHAFAHNAGKPFTVALAPQAAAGAAPRPVQYFELDAIKDEERVVVMENPDGARQLRIVVPQPVSPNELGAQGDDRTLGVAITKLKIVPLQ